MRRPMGLGGCLACGLALGVWWPGAEPAPRREAFRFLVAAPAARTSSVPPEPPDPQLVEMALAIQLDPKLEPWRPKPPTGLRFAALAVNLDALGRAAPAGQPSVPEAPRAGLLAIALLALAARSATWQRRVG